jgi:tetratricopeptide (TPR) repeat protein
VEEVGDKQQDPAARVTYYNKARLAYEQALETDPTMHVATIRLARLHEKMGDGAAAAKCLEDALVKHPQEAIFWCELGLCRARQKDWDRAIKHLQRAAQLEPKSPVYSNHVGWALARAGLLDESLEHFRRTVGDARAYYNLAKMTKHLNRPDLSREYVAAALSIDPQFAEDREFLAQLDAPPPTEGAVHQATHVEIEQ